MPKATTFHSDVHLRIKNVKNIELVEKIYNESSSDKITINDILNDALDIGLSSLAEGSPAPSTISDMMKKETDRILKNQNRCTQNLMSQIDKLLALNLVQEEMIGSIIQEFEFFLKANGISIDDELLKKFKLSLPARFEESKQYYINTLVGEDNE